VPADGRIEHVVVPMADGTRLATTLYLPAVSEPVPCLLEALPYRKDDLTATYRPEYVRLRDEHAFAVARVDVRGTGSSEGLATDEYPEQEQEDLGEVIAWLAAQPWCSGAVGMFGTSYSGFNSLHLAACQPPALGAVVAIYSSDDRYTDDVHYMGGALRLLDVVDYPTYMVAMNALPPVPSLFGHRWVDEWHRRVEDLEPWLLRWVQEQCDSAYWRQGSVRPAYDRIRCPTMLVGGWADGYRNNTFRTVTALQGNGVPHRLLLGPWSHMSTATSLPGPHLDLVPVMARWFDRWLRGDDSGGYDDEPALTWFAQRSTGPAPDRSLVEGEWRSAPSWPLAGSSVDEKSLGSGVVSYEVRPDVGTAAWNSCAGSLPWGQPADQRFDDAASITWEWPSEGFSLLGHPVLRLRVASSQPVASLSAKLCDVFADGTSSLLCRGLLNLTHRASSASPSPLPVDEWVDVELEMEAMSFDAVRPGHVLRLSLAGVDWPNTVAPPRPLTLRIDRSASSLLLPVSGHSVPAVGLPLLPPPAREPSDVVWRVSRDVLRRRTECVDEHGSDYDVEGGSVSERYTGLVSVAQESFEQCAEATADFTVRWPEATVRARSEVVLAAGAEAFDLSVVVSTWRDDEPFLSRTWTRRIARQLG
jgi:predicted acyl esterase